MLLKTTTKLFYGKYQYKTVLVCSGAQLFRGCDLERAEKSLECIDLAKNSKDKIRRNIIKTPEEYKYAVKLLKKLKKLQDFDLRVESPWISIYSNNEQDINSLNRLDESRVKYTSSPASGTSLTVGTIIMSKRNFDYKITLGRTHNENSSFVQWAESQTGRVQLTKSCKRHLLQNGTWGGSHFYLTGDNVLLMAKMHLGGSISKIERITKQ